MSDKNRIGETRTDFGLASQNEPFKSGEGIAAVAEQMCKIHMLLNITLMDKVRDRDTFERAVAEMIQMANQDNLDPGMTARSALQVMEMWDEYIGSKAGGQE